MSFKKHPRQTGMASSRGLRWDTSPRLLPVCCVCGFVRDDTHQDDQERWLPPTTLRSAVLLSSIALVFTHTYCPDCLEAVRNGMRQASSGNASK